jgi:hypothetical protein
MARKKKGANCSSACVTRDHKTFGECMRSKNLQVNPRLADGGVTAKAWDKELSDYRDAKAQGINPHGTTREKIDEAVRMSEETGVAYT